VFRGRNDPSPQRKQYGDRAYVVWVVPQAEVKVGMVEHSASCAMRVVVTVVVNVLQTVERPMPP